jgi:integrase
MACVKRRRGKWVADYRDHTGKRHWETYETRKEAQRALAGHTVALKDNRYVPPNDRRTVKDAFDSWLKLCVEGSDNKSGKPLRPATQALYSMTWRVHVGPRWGALKLRQADPEAIARWKQEKLDAGAGAKTVINALQLLGSVFRHARRFKWTATNPLEDVHRPRYKSKVAAFTPAQIAALLEQAGSDAGLFIRLAASTGMRFGELAGLRWSDVSLEKGTVRVTRQYSHGAWAELKTENARRTLPLAATLRDELKARYADLNGTVVRLHGSDDRTVFCAPEGAPLDYKNFRDRVWAPLLVRTGPDKEHPQRVAVVGTMHMLRHSYATALIQSGENAKTVQTLMGHHSVAFTMDQYADAWPEQIASAGEAAARLLLPSGSKTVASGPR